LEHSRIFDERLWDRVAGAVRGAVVLALRVRGVVIRERRGILLSSLPSRRLARVLRRLRELLGLLSIGWGKTRSSVRLLRRHTLKTLDVVMPEGISVTEACLTVVGIVEALLTNVSMPNNMENLNLNTNPLSFTIVLVVLGTEATEVRCLILVSKLSRKLPKRAIWSILTLIRGNGRRGRVEIRLLLLTEV
jgi:hypothetical protein